MESTGEPGQAQISDATAALLTPCGCFELARRGLVEAKGKGFFETHWLRGRVAGCPFSASAAAREPPPQLQPAPRGARPLAPRRAASLRALLGAAASRAAAMRGMSPRSSRASSATARESVGPPRRSAPRISFLAPPGGGGGEPRLSAPQMRVDGDARDELRGGGEDEGAEGECGVTSAAEAKGADDPSGAAGAEGPWAMLQRFRRSSLS